MHIKQVRPFPVPLPKMACVARYGAWGDAVLCSPVFKRLKEAGYYVVFNCTERAYEVQAKNPNIDSFWILKTNEIPAEELDAYWKKLSTTFDRFINLNGSIEETLLKTPWSEEYQWTKEKRHEACNKNYMDHTMDVAGFPEFHGEITDLYFKKREEDWAAMIRAKYSGFLVVYSLSGSASHKTYPYANSVIHAIVEGLEDATVILVGESGCKGIIEPHPRIIDMCGAFGIRRSYILTKIADLVISTETSVACASGSFDTPKIILLSHSSHENLTKYWRNCYPIEPPAACFPCHKLHYTEKTCPTKYFEVGDGNGGNVKVGGPVCVALLKPEMILEKVEQVYDQFKKRTT